MDAGAPSTLLCLVDALQMIVATTAVEALCDEGYILDL